MKNKEKLYFLIHSLIQESYDIKLFCKEFSQIYDLELDYTTLTALENNLFNELSELTGRFSDNAEDLKIPNVYYSEQDIRDYVSEIATKLDI
ncbi:hypothetical protein [Carnobacterium maltaromaticum]|uniref:hypothetical protein n=1 Tax=Carnobacterium maltaromaticum TaxID=2751 RepID=UPI00191BBE83|nr:hypothetical protein [Carnobacterium maltaromaticum]CAD5898169.1 Magnesium and cobalt transport protein CorA [Carnobacterium maltaromaticum]